MRGPQDRRVLFFGDSHVVGVGDPTGLGWVGRVAAWAAASDLPITAYNLGVRGDTSVHVAARWRGEGEARLLSGARTGIVLAFGVNDTTIGDGERRVAAEDSREALSTILDDAATIGLPALVVGPAPIDDPEQNRRIEDLSASLSEACVERETPFIASCRSLLASRVWMEQVAADDGAHPSSEGYGALAETVLAGGFLDWLRGI
jgi:acyl-CoA thioesterase-1